MVVRVGEGECDGGWGGGMSVMVVGVGEGECDGGWGGGMSVMVGVGG